MFRSVKSNGSLYIYERCSALASNFIFTFPVNPKKFIMRWYIYVLKQYTVFSGRASRREFWSFAIVNFMITVALYYLALQDSSGIMTVVLGLYLLGIVIPGLSVTIRRLHDVNANGWWLLLLLIPVIGSVPILYLLLRSSYYTENQYGPYPDHEFKLNSLPGVE